MFETDTIKLSTGKEIYANRGFVGININAHKTDRDSVKEGGAKFEISEGYDGYIDLNKYDSSTNSYLPDFTHDELIELADIVINRWCEFILAVEAGRIPVKAST